MNWGGWSDFFAMGGYALYVWGSYAVTLGLMVMEILLLALRGRGILGRLARSSTRNQP
jgi:heme exporter protein D